MAYYSSWFVATASTELFHDVPKFRNGRKLHAFDNVTTPLFMVQQFFSRPDYIKNRTFIRKHFKPGEFYFIGLEFKVAKLGKVWCLWMVGKKNAIRERKLRGQC